MKSNAAPATPIALHRAKTFPKIAPAARIVERADVKADFARELSEELQRMGMPKAEAARGFDIDRPYFSRCLTEHEKAALSVVHLASGDRSVQDIARFAARWLCGRLGLQAVESAAIEHGDDHVARLSAVANGGTAPLRTFAEALSDRVVTRDEWLEIRADARRAIAVFRELEACATQQINEGNDD
jgi:hypothetical protein